MKLGGERKRSTYDWSSQGGKLPRCVLPRTGVADAAELRVRNCLRALQWTPQELSGWISWQGSRQKAAQTSSVAARLTAVQPSPAGRCGTHPRGPLTCASRRVSTSSGAAQNAAYLPTGAPPRRPVETGSPAVGLSQARKLAVVSVPVSGQTVKSCAAGRTHAVVRRTRHSDHSARKAELGGLCRSGMRLAGTSALTCTFAHKQHRRR